MFFAAVRLQRNRKTPERITIGKPLYFCLPEFVGEFFRSGALPIGYLSIGQYEISGTPLPVKG
jgi:hypothetical protein